MNFGEIMYLNNGSAKVTLVLSVAMLVGSLNTAAQMQNATAPEPVAPTKVSLLMESQLNSAINKWSFAWGWNREVYSKSDIHFSGTNHDFTLSDVKAKDKQKELTLGTLFTTFLNPGNLTIPQTNMRIAYQLSKDTAVAFNLDHMKYVVSDGQTVRSSGSYTNSSGTTTLGATKTLNADFMHYEHTDGLNIISLEYEKQYSLEIPRVNMPARAFSLVGLGFVMPKSNITMTMIEQTRNDQFHIAGYSAAVGGGVEADFLKRYFVRGAYKFGYVNLPDVKTSARGDKASQSFTYNELLMLIGVRF
jgi:hypothetical protein